MHLALMLNVVGGVELVGKVCTERVDHFPVSGYPYTVLKHLVVGLSHRENIRYSMTKFNVLDPLLGIESVLNSPPFGNKSPKSFSKPESSKSEFLP